jgi:RNA polymerase sigma factor (sigma-70 family)
MGGGSQGPDDRRRADDGFDALFRRELGPITRTAYLVVGDWEVACELAQDAFVQALRRWDEVRVLDRPGAWVRRVAVRDAVRARRRRIRGRALEAQHARAADETEPVAPDVRAALLGLSARQRAAIALHYLDDLPVTEIAATLGCSVGSVKTHLARGRRALAVLLGAEVADERR